MDNALKKPVVHLHESSGLHYLRGQEKVFFETGIIISREDFEKYKDSDLAHFLKAVSENPACRDYDFSYACSTGRIRKKRGYGPIISRRKQETEAVEAVPEKIQTPPGTPWPEPNEEQKERPGFSSVLLVVIVMAVVGVGSAVMSAYHTGTFLHSSGKPVWAAVMTGVMLILFSATAFTAARYFFKEKGASKAFGVLFVAAGFAVISYSVFSTITVNYDQFKWVEDEKSAIAVEDSEALAAADRLLEQNARALTDIDAEISRLESEAEFWRSQSWRRYDEMQEQLKTALDERNRLRAERAEMEASRPDLMSQAEQSRETIYLFLSRLFGIPQDTARFFAYVVPAVLYDILAPFALSVVLLLLDRRKNDAKASI